MFHSAASTNTVPKRKYISAYDSRLEPIMVGKSRKKPQATRYKNIQSQEQRGVNVCTLTRFFVLSVTSGLLESSGPFAKRMDGILHSGLGLLTSVNI